MTIKTLENLRTRRQARTAYAEAETDFNATWDRLHTTEEPSARAALLRCLGDLTGRLAILHTPAFGTDPIAKENGRPRAEALTATAGLWRLASIAEAELAAATWTPVEELRPGQEVYFAWEFGRVVEVIELPPVEDGKRLFDVLLGYGDGEASEVQYTAGETVRTGGPVEIVILELARQAGAGDQEVLEWGRLAATYDRDHRAAILFTLADLVADRVGATAAEALNELGECEAHLMLPAPARPGGRLPADLITRVLLAVVFMVAGAVMVVPGLPLLARTGLLTTLVSLPWLSALLADRRAARTGKAVRS